MIFPNGDQWSAEFLSSEPAYDEPAWVDAYTLAIGRLKPELTPATALTLARDAYAREGSWNNPKIAAGCDAVLGPLIM
ncbi:MAG: hypothetical protein U1E89_04585 [Burkholderiaceae bacterium]